MGFISHTKDRSRRNDWNSDIRIKRRTGGPKKAGGRLLRFFDQKSISIFGIELVAGNIEFFFLVADRNVGEHENLMRRKNAEVFVRKDNQFVPIEHLKFSSGHLPSASLTEGF